MRTRRAQRLDSKSGTAITGNSFDLNANPSNHKGFLVEFLLVEHKISWSGGSPSGTLGATNVGSTRHDWDWTNNRKMLNNVTGRTLDLWAKRQRLPGCQAYDVLANQAINASGDYLFRHLLPMVRHLDAVPDDGVVALSDIGRLAVTTPDLTAVAGTGTGFTWQTTVYAIGYDGKPGEFRAGTLFQLAEIGSDTSTSQTLNAGGDILRDLFAFSKDTASSPVSGDTAPQLLLDNTPTQLWNNFTSADLCWLQGALYSADDYSDYVTVAGVLNTLIENLVPYVPGRKISQLPNVRTITINYTARTATATNIVYVLETLYPSQGGAALAARLPAGFSDYTADQLRAAVKRPGIAEVDPALAAYLPAVVVGG